MPVIRLNFIGATSITYSFGVQLSGFAALTSAPHPDSSYAGCTPGHIGWLLQPEAECNVDAGIHRIAQVIHAIDLDHINVLRVEPIAWPRVNESERIATVLEAAIPTVVALADAKRVFPAKIGLVTVVGNAATASIAAACFQAGLSCVCCCCCASFSSGLAFFSGCCAFFSSGLAFFSC